MNKSDVVRAYRTKHPDMPTLALARYIYKKESILFPTLEAVRTRLRAIEGKADGGNTKITHPTPPRPYNPYKLPESYQKERKPFVLPKLHNNILLISDVHVPYHDINAITTAIEYGKQTQVNTIFINGDLVDFHGLSKYEKDPRKRSVKQELDAGRAFLQALRSAFPDAAIYWLYGNHDIRYERWLMTKCMEIFDDPYYHLEQRLRLNELNVKAIDDKTLVKAGKLAITHGHHIFKGVFAPVSPARGAFLRAKQPVIVGHLHRASHHPEVDLDGKVISCWSTGCLCELRPDYSPLVSNSQHGFAHITVDSSGHYHVKNHQIINGKLY